MNNREYSSGGGKRKRRILFVATVAIAAVFFIGCAKPQTIEKIVYINKPCDRASDFAPAQWQKVRWFGAEINGSASACTSDINALLGNLLRMQNCFEKNK